MVNEKKVNFIEKVENFCLEQKLFKRGEKIIIGFSGGADSTALLAFFYHIRSKYHLSLLAAHVNYHLRGDESNDDEQFVKQFCFQRNISLVIHNMRLDSVKNIETQARKIRFDFFQQLLKLYKMNKIALGHQREDQAETVLFRLIRGAGFHGLRGIEPQNSSLIHPFLGVSRTDIKAFLVSENLTWREDSSNLEITFTRNKIRHQMLPWIQENMNPNIYNRLNTLTSIFHDTDLILQELAQRKIENIQTTKDKGSIKIDISLLKKSNPTLRFYMYQYAFEQTSGIRQDFYYAHFQEIESILHSSGSKKLMLPHQVVVFKEYEEMRFLSELDVISTDMNNKREISSIRTRFSFEDYRITMLKYKTLPSNTHLSEDKNEVYLDLDSVCFPLIIRHRQPGDKFIPFGMTQHKKLKDFFIDEKVPKFERDKILVFSDAEKIIWIGGLRIDARAALNKNTKMILKIRLEKLTHQKVRHAERVKK
jgi:tRNA(Ile)-lysidine synthase